SEVLDRPFDPVIDGGYLGHGVAFVRDTLGPGAAIGAVVGVVVAAVVVLVLMPLALLRLSRLVAEHPRTALRTGAAATLVWLLSAVLGLHVAAGEPVAAAGTATYAYDEVARIPSVLRDQRDFATAAKHDPLDAVPSDQLLTTLRGKDVLFVFVESYGRVAVQGTRFSDSIDQVLRAGTTQLAAQGYGMRSAFLTSPTFGAGSWLAHSSLQSGLWVDGQQRYDALVTSRRQNLSTTFHRAGWRTAGDVPANTHDWPQGRFYGYDTVYDSRNVGYKGPRFGYPTMPDQYTLDHVRRTELQPADRKPVMAEIDLISSHFSWATLPRMVPWSSVGDGTVFAGQPAQNPSKKEIYSSDDRVQDAYARSIRYSLSAVIGYLSTYVDPNTVMVFLGDHQPNATVSGHDSGHDVPVTVVAKDPKVIDAISSWHWQDGLLPSPDAPTWRMDTFRDRFLTAFGTTGLGGGAHSGSVEASRVR
ncbi:MAG: hypothetical protein JWO46_329, partial [Nocardioidaceae bacterium]|nr:hypothetical protein [Nocardioidaceae bacterium]